MTIEEVASDITELVLEHTGLCRLAEQYAQRETGIDGKDLEDLKGTAQYDLYWSIISDVQVRTLWIVQGLIQPLAGMSEPNKD